MKLITRAQWGARSWKQPNGSITYSGARKGVKIHYLGTAYPSRLHDQCATFVRAIQNQHMNGNGWSDIGYSFLVCEHGYVFEGRGLQRRNSGNGNTTLNNAHYAVCALLGSSGLTDPTDAQLHGLRDAVEHCRSKGPAGSEIRGHRDGYATVCPGGPLYAWVNRGAPRPASKEVSVALTKAEYVEIARHVWQRDGLIRNPNPATNERNTHIAGGTGLRNIEIVVRRIERTLAAQDAIIAQLVTALADRDQVDPDALISRITAALGDVTITLNVEDGEA